MNQGLQITCPVCGWTLLTPKGEDDLMEHIDMHGKKYHADMPMTPEQIKGAIKTVSMTEAAYHRV